MSKHVSCPTCYKSAESYHFFYDEDSGDEFEETEPEKHTYLKNYHCWEEQYVYWNRREDMIVHPQDMPSFGFVKRISAVFTLKNTMVHVEGKQ